MGFPCSFVNNTDSSWISFLTTSMPLCMSCARDSAEVSAQDGNAALALSMAARASFSVPLGAESTTSPLAGLITSYVCPELEPVASPAMNIFAMRPLHFWSGCRGAPGAPAAQQFKNSPGVIRPPLPWLTAVLYCQCKVLSTCSIVQHVAQLSLLSHIGSRVRARRTSMGWTLREIAERSGVSPRFLSDLEAGRGNISVLRLADVARALDVPLVSLMPSDETQKRVVSLVGLRGAGKSTIGKGLAKHLGARFLELDALIEQQANLSLGD